jgi:uncharacterized protein involved in outer membrane biogenesis
MIGQKMSRWKKILIAAAVVVVVLMVALYAFLMIYDFNKFKPMLTRAVRDAIGRELTIAGDIEFEPGIRPILTVEDVKFQNAPWSSAPDLATVKRLEVQVAVLPMIVGKFDFARLVLVEPNVIVEFDSSGSSNFAFETGAAETGTDDSPIPPPPLIFSDVLIENGRFTYRDSRSDFEFKIRIDHLKGEIPGFDEPLQVDFKGAFDDKPFTLKGTFGPIWAWVEPGYPLPADLTATAGSATATIKGELRDPANFKGLAFEIAARGASVSEITGLAGLAGVPKLGAFRLAADVNDSAGALAIENLNIEVGSQELVAIALTGGIKDVPARQGINLKFSARGQDSTKLSQLGFPALPEQGAFQLTANISDPEAKVYSVSDLDVVLGDNEIKGQIDLNLAQEIPRLTAGLKSHKFRYGQLDLDLKMIGPAEKPAIEKIDLEVGNPDLAKVKISGNVEDLRELQGVTLTFEAAGKDLANLEKLTGQPFPVRGAFNAAGKILIPVRQNLKIPDLKITAGKNNISGTLDLNFRGERPQLQAKLSLPQLDLPSVLRPEHAKQGWATGLGLMRPVRLAAALDGFAPDIALKKVDLQAGTLESAELRLTGSVADLAARKGIDLNFSLRGNEVGKLYKITAQKSLFTPVPGQGAYAFSGRITDPTANVYQVEDFKFVMADTEATGRMRFNLSDQPFYEIELSGPKFNLKPFPIPKDAAYANLNKIDDLGPIKIHSKIVVGGGDLSLAALDLQAGSEKLASVSVKGSIKNFTRQTGIDLDINVRGDEVANLKEFTGQPIPLKGPYSLSGKLTDPAQKNFKLSDLNLKLGSNNISGSLDLNLSAKTPGLAANLAAPKLTLEPVTLPALETLSRIEDLGPLKLALKVTGSGNKLALDNLDFNAGRQDLIQVTLKGTISDLSAVRGMRLDFSASGSDMSNIGKLGGPEVPFTGTFNISGQFVDPAPKVYKMPSLNADFGNNNQSGWLELDLSAKRPSLKGELSSDKLDLRPLLPEEKEKKIEKTKARKPEPPKEKRSKGDVQTPKPSVSHERVFPAEPLPIDGLQAIDADLKIRQKQVLLPRLALDNVILDILLKNGNLEIKPFTFSIGGGKADAQFALRSQEKPTALSTTLKIDQLEIGPMLDNLGYERSVEGNMDADFNLTSTGDSIADLMAALNGNTHIAMSNGKAASRYLELLEKWLGSGILQMINPFEEKREFTPINCFVNSIEIKDGEADVKVLLDTDRTSIIGAGDINLKTERLDMGIKPTPKKGAMPANISFSLRQLSQPFRLGGTLANPQLAIDPGRTAFILGKVAGALALGPIGIAAFFADISVGKKNACEIAREAGAKRGQSRGAPETAEESDSGGEKKKERKSGGFFQRLFGR